MNKNEVLHIIFLALVDEDLFQLIKEKKDNTMELNEISLHLNDGESNLKDGNMHIFNERKLNVKDFKVKIDEMRNELESYNVKETVRRNDHRELLLLVVRVLHHLCKEARYLTRNILITDTTQYVNNLEDTVTKTIFWN